jgi:hypothetical protein
MSFVDSEKVIYCIIRYSIYVRDHAIATISLATILNEFAFVTGELDAAKRV